MTITASDRSSQLTTVQGEPAIRLDLLPECWQAIAVEGNWMSEPQVYTAMTQVFLAKHSYGHLLFLEHPHTLHLQSAFCEAHSKLAWETVMHFGEAFLPENYPNFRQIRHDLCTQAMAERDADFEKLLHQLALVDIVTDLFNELGCDVPSTFYWAFLYPLQHPDLFEMRSFRFSKQQRSVVRKFDVILHAGCISMLRRLIDSISSRHGYFVEYGYGGESHLAQLKSCDTAFIYRLSDDARRKTLRAFFWTVMEEYLLFELRSGTRLVYTD